MSTRRAAILVSGPAEPTEVLLREAALRHLARYAATTAGLVRVLDRRVARWQHSVTQDGGELPEEAVRRARAGVRSVVAALAANGVVDDAAFAESRARLLLRSGRSRLKVAQHLATRGIDPDTVRRTVPAGDDDETRELAAAVLLVRKRRLGRFGEGTSEEQGLARRRALGVLARAGFGHAVARSALDVAPEEAEALIERMRRG